MTPPPPRYFFLGRPFRCRRLTSDLHSWVLGAQALSHFTLPLHLSPHSQPPLRYVLYPFLCSLSRTALTGLLQTRVILQSETLFLHSSCFRFRCQQRLPRSAEGPASAWVSRQTLLPPSCVTSVKGSYLSQRRFAHRKMWEPRFPPSKVAVRHNR